MFSGQALRHRQVHEPKNGPDPGLCSSPVKNLLQLRLNSKLRVKKHRWGGSNTAAPRFFLFTRACADKRLARHLEA